MEEGDGREDITVRPEAGVGVGVTAGHVEEMEVMV